MKKIINMLLFLAATTFFAACTPTVDDAFPESSAQRIATSISETKTVLQSSSTGWLMRMYGDLQFGGYNVFCKFEGDYVTVMNELYGSDQTKTSHYKVDQSAGVILSFDGYNELFHFFSDPHNPAGMGNDAYGFRGDLEFRVITANSDSIVMVGKKTLRRIVMTPAPEDWADYLAKVTAMEKNLEFANFKLTLGDKAMRTSLSSRMFSAKDPETGDVTKLPFIVTDKGIELYTTYTLNGKELKAFAVSDAEVWPETSDNTVTLAPAALPLNEQLVEGLWFMSFSNMGSDAQAAWLKTAQALTKISEVPYMAAFGTFDMAENDFVTGLLFGSHSSEGKNYYGQLGYNYSLQGEDEITISSFNSANNRSNGSWYYGNGFYVDGPASLLGTFKITTDDPMNPTYLKIVNTKNENIWYKLVPTWINDMMNN